MKVILLSAGFGYRLKPLTNKTPKCLVTINGVPLLKIWINRLSRQGLGPFLVNTHYLKDQVEKFVNSLNNSNKVTLKNEEELLGTAGTLISNIDFFEGKDGLLIHADNYCLADFREFIKAHNNRPKKCLLTMMTFQTETPKTCGILELDSNNVVKAIHEKTDNPPGKLANGAIYILSSELLFFLKNQKKTISDFSTEILPKLIGKIYTFETSETFIDIGTKEAYDKANRIATLKDY